ncbi:hypothetical protein BTJ68_12361 [Hortaea werneckii EXF-2000]|uniref:Serine/threonine-protein kinase Tel1 n=1 Tax=Hortaea werneckii EXF-2000 TaxID=1157616 RepID=A0A1Z5SW22_HORWE|nr:hypothetical protein BTJ68_12361 [Hortaea werneckii EXF-2000]
MGGEVTLIDALERAQSGGLKQRAEGLQDLKHVLRYNIQSADIGALKGASFHKIFEVLFDIVKSEKGSWMTAKTATTRSSAETRLSNASSTLRLAIEAGIRSSKLKTVKTVLDHVTETIAITSGRLCLPLMLDYAKCLRQTVSYQPHAEHLPQDYWAATVSFCLQILRKVTDELNEDKAPAGTGPSSVATSMSNKSSRSQTWDSGQSQSVRSLYKQLNEEIVGALSPLTATPNAPLSPQAARLLWALIDFLQNGSGTDKSQQEAFASINHVLAWASTESVELTKKASIQLVRLVKNHWPSKSIPKAEPLINEMLITLLYLKPYMAWAIQREDSTSMRLDLSSMHTTLREEYSGRKERDQLRFDDVRCHGRLQEPETEGTVRVAAFSLKPGSGSRAASREACWILAYILGYLNCILSSDVADRSVPSDGEHEEGGRRPVKRQRLSDDWLELLATCNRGSASAKICSLQMIVFVGQEKSLSAQQISQAIDAVSAACSEENFTVASWAFAALASCATQKSATNQVLSGRWAGIWQLASRAIGNSATSRAACHLMNTLMQSQLASNEMVAELVQCWATSVELNGPSVLADSVLNFVHDAFLRAHQLAPGTVNSLAESLVGWLFRTYGLAKFEDRFYTADQHLWDPRDFLNLLSTCLDHHVQHQRHVEFPVWTKVAQVWIACSSQSSLVDYLLLLPDRSEPINPMFFENNSVFEAGRSLGRIGCETIVLNSLIPDLQTTVESWNRWRHDRPQHISTEMFKTICQACCVVACLSHCHEFRDRRRQNQMQSVFRELLDGCTSFAATPFCSQDKLDAMMLTFAESFTGPSNQDQRHHSTVCACENMLCRKVQEVLFLRKNRNLYGSKQDDDDIDLDMDGNYDSQDSRQSRGQYVVQEPRTIHSSIFSLLAAKANIEVYSKAIATMHGFQSDLQQEKDASSNVTDYILSLPEETVCAASRTIAALPAMGLVLMPDDAYRLLESCMENVLSVYAYERCEAAMTPILEIMASLMPLWTEYADEQLSGLAMDVYEWFIGVLRAKVLSSNVQKTLALLLLDLCRRDLDYGQNDSIQSVRTSLFELLRTGSIQSQHHMSGRIPMLFGLYVLSRHENIFEDLQNSLANEADWAEGIAMRLLVLSKLASAWHTLLRTCVFYIFEAAGRLKGLAEGYAMHSIALLTRSLGFDSAQKLFLLFAPQLLYTWLEGNNTLSSLPYPVFQYSSLEELFKHNEVEITAQLFMRGREDDLHFLSKSMKLSIPDLAKRAFPKTLAYALSWDTAKKPDEASAVTSEGRLRSVLGGKQEVSKLASRYFPTIMGIFYLSAQQDDAQDAWMEKREECKDSARALAEMKSYSSSTRTLPGSQQPSFRPRYLMDQVGRLCRRTAQDPEQPWTVSSFTLVVRMHLDAIDDALGPLHRCALLRKLRVLVACSGSIAFSAAPLELLLHSLAPFLGDSECADDTLGVMQFLLTHGQSYLKQEGASFAHSVVMSMILYMRKHSDGRHESTTQESQHRHTVQKMEGFQLWLVNYLQKCHASSKRQAAALVKALESLRLPGNGRRDSPESALLLLLLELQQHPSPIVSRQYCNEALHILTRDFESPSSVADDCLGSDRACAKYADSLWLFLKAPDIDPEFLNWSAVILGRSYAATGARPQALDVPELPTLKLQNAVAESQATITQRLTTMLASSDRKYSGLADWTLRNALQTFKDPGEALNFERMIPDVLVPTLADGAFGYMPPAVAAVVPETVDRKALQDALAVESDSEDEVWLCNLATTLCRWASYCAILPALPPIIKSVSKVPSALLGPIIHILLSEDMKRDSAVRSDISSSMTAHFTKNTEALKPRQQFWIEIYLYLRQQPYPGETSQADRSRWLDVDLLLAAETAARCGMPTAALYLAESIAPASQTNRRSSSRVSMSQLSSVDIPDDLLLSIFKQVEEPDSYYGVQQPPSLEAVLGKFDYEKDGLRSLMFRSAQMDSAMRISNAAVGTSTMGILQSLSALNMHSLEYMLLSAPAASTPSLASETLETARRLQQWDIASPETSSGGGSLFSALQEISRSGERDHVASKIKSLIGDQAVSGMKRIHPAVPGIEWCNNLAALVEIRDGLDAQDDMAIRSFWQKMTARSGWMRARSYDDCKTLTSNRAILFGVLAQNRDMLQSMHITPKIAMSLEIEALLATSRLAREQEVLQEALSACTQVNQLATKYKDSGLKISSAADYETAMVLWGAGESSASVQMLRRIAAQATYGNDDIKVGHPTVLAELAHQLAEARLEKPEEIRAYCLTPAVDSLGGRRKGTEAGKVFHEYATFCDQQLQNPGNNEDFSRISMVRQKRLEDIRELETLSRRKSGYQKKELDRSISQAHSWYALDNEEYERLNESRSAYTRLSIQNYLLSLQASDDHDIDVLRFFALWFENSESDAANDVVRKHLSNVPSWKFVVLNNQLMPRLEEEQSTFQGCLKHLIERICAEHPHHSLHHLYAACTNPDNMSDTQAMSRCRGAKGIRNSLRANEQSSETISKVWEADAAYENFSKEEPPDRNKSKVATNTFQPAVKLTNKIKSLNVPPATIHLPLRPDGNYEGAPVVRQWGPSMQIMDGLSHPKVLTAQASDGSVHKQLFKYNDDLRQDAIMEQVFEEVSKMLRHHKQARQRNLHVRTYKVVPLGTKCGILEWVQNTVPIGGWLVPAHTRYYPGSMARNKAASKIREAQNLSKEGRVKEYRAVCDQLPPVLRHFFFERFTDPDVWFEKRTAYTRTTATISILGYVLGLGDRHIQNILLDEKSGEAVHIDLGVAFEAGRVLPVPETVPFRLSRDIVDGMGVTKTEGIFRRCCEFTMDALREDKDSIMTLLNVLRYDPLHQWTLSPLRAKRMQDAQATGRNARGADGDEPSSKRKEQEGGEAGRALATVEKKLSKTLSTAATVNELIQQATDERNLALLFAGWSAFF